MAGGEKEVGQAVYLAFISFHIYLDGRASCVCAGNFYVGASGFRFERPGGRGICFVYRFASNLHDDPVCGGRKRSTKSAIKLDFDKRTNPKE